MPRPHVAVPELALRLTHYGLQKLIMARLPKDVEISISMAILVMCAEKILRLLCLLFDAFCAWICCRLRLGPLLVALWKICQLEAEERPQAVL